MSEPSDEVDRLADAVDAFLARAQTSDPTKIISILEDRPDLREFLEPMLANDGDEAASEGGTPEQIGPYVIHSELGRGGMGIVYAAEHQQLRRPAAVKVLPELMSLSPRRIRRFLREAKVAARLDHPGLARIHEVGEVAGTWWFAMDLVEGETLRDRLHAAVELATVDPSDARLWIAGCDSRYEEAAELGIQLADSLAHAHAHGLVHRDVKPQNIMVDEVGRIRLVDFGLAKDLEDQTLTGTGDFMGTPHYTAPEQVEPHRDQEIDARADLFSVGCVMYEVLTLRRPFDGRSTESILRAVVSDEPKPVSSLDASIPRDLETIVARALEKNPEHRYQTASELLEDLRRFRSGAPIAARPRSGLSKASRWVRRHPGGAFSILLAFALFVVTPITATFVLESKNTELSVQRDVALRNFEAANRAVDQLFTRIAESPMASDERLQPFRRALLEDARTFYLEFLERAQVFHIVGIRREVSMATARVAVVDYELSRYDAAATGFANALQLMTALAPEDQNSLDLADIHASRGMALMALGNTERAREDFAAAAAVWRHEENGPGWARSQAKWARMEIGRANHLRLTDPDQALADLDQALARLDKLETAGKSGPSVALDRGSAQSYRAQLLLSRGDLAGAAKAVSLSERAFKTQASAPRARHLQSSTGLVRAQLLQQKGDRTQAERLFRECWQELQRRSKVWVDNSGTRYELVHTADLYSKFLIGQQRYDEAFEIAQAGIATAEQLAAQDVGKNHQKRLLQTILTTTATAATFGAFADVSAIDEWFEQALELHRELLRSHPEDPLLMGSLGGTLNNYAMRFLRREPRDRTHAVTLLLEAADLQRQALVERPKEVLHQNYLWNHLILLAPSLLKLDRPDEAYDALMESRRYHQGRLRSVIRNCALLVECARFLGDEAKKQHCLDLAFSDLKQARATDTAAVQRLAGDPRFKHVAEHPRFLDLVR